MVVVVGTVEIRSGAREGYLTAGPRVMREEEVGEKIKARKIQLLSIIMSEVYNITVILARLSGDPAGLTFPLTCPKKGQNFTT